MAKWEEEEEEEVEKGAVERRGGALTDVALILAEIGAEVVTILPMVVCFATEALTLTPFATFLLVGSFLLPALSLKRSLCSRGLAGPADAAKCCC